MTDFSLRFLKVLATRCRKNALLIVASLSFAPLYAQTTYKVESRDLLLLLEKQQVSGFQGLKLLSLEEKKNRRVLTAGETPPLFTLSYSAPGAGQNQLPAHADSVAWKQIGSAATADGIVFSFRGFGNSTPGADLSVEMKLEASPEKDGIEISYRAAAGSGHASVSAMTIARFSFRDFGKQTRLFLPHGSGIVLNDPVGLGPRNWKHGYPGYAVPMPWFALWSESTGPDGFRTNRNTGIYLGVHDQNGSRKEIACTVGKNIQLQVTVQAENMYEPDNEFSIGGKTVLRTLQNDWFDGAMVYKDWVRREASWFPRTALDENGRKDSPQWIKEHSLWAMHRVSPEEMTPVMKDFRQAFGVPAAVHWYYWHKNPYDNDYPHFFPRDGFREAVQELQKNNDIFIMPYINGLLWDSRDRGMEDWLYTSEAVAGTSKGTDGKPRLYTYGSKESDGSDVKLAHMCPATEIWQKKVLENVLRLARENGTKAVYIDQVAAAIPELCFDRSHGHPLGGGNWWNAGYRKMLENVHAELARAGLNDVAITTECTGETSLPIVDGFLTWHHQLENQVPAFSAVYGGTIQMIGRDYRAGKTYAERTEPRMKKTNEPLACRMKAAEALCFGEQIGWFVPTITEEDDKFPFLKDVVHLRNRFRTYFYKGEMCRVPQLDSNVPRVTADWNFYDSPLISAPALRTGAWKLARNGKTASVVVLFANTSSENITASVKLELSEYGIDPKKMSVFRIDANGGREKLTARQIRQPVTFTKESVSAWEITCL